MKKPTKTQRLLQKWLDAFHQIEEIEEIEKEFSSLMGAGFTESKASSALWKMFDFYTEMLSERLGDDLEWLPWFIHENDAGRRGFEASAPGMKRAIKVSTLKDLEKLINASK